MRITVLMKRTMPCRPGIGRKAAMPPISPVIGANRALHQLVDGEQDVGLGEALGDDLLRVGDLALAVRHFAARRSGAP